MPLVERRFVILRHEQAGSAHWDFLLEAGEALAAWRIEILPGDLPRGESAPARRLPDHRRQYLSYEGPVSRGRGTVRRVESGACEVLREEEGLWEVRLAGPASRGTFELRRVGPADEDWQLRPLSGETGESAPAAR